MSDNDFSRPPAAPAPDPAAADQAPAEFLDAHSRRRLAWALGIAGGIVLLLLAATYGAYFMRFGDQPSGDQGTWGQFGDFVGGTLNSLLGLLTLLALVFTVVLQTRQLELSRDELRATRDELARSTAAQRDAAAAMNGQLEQARLTAKAQAEAALHQLATAKAMAEQLELAKVTISLQRQSANSSMVATEHQILAQAIDVLTKQRGLIEEQIQAGSPIPSDVPRHRETLCVIDQHRAQLAEAILQAALQLLNREAASTHAASS